MAITIPINNFPTTPIINMKEFQLRVADYAVALWEQMAKAEAAKVKQADIKYHTSPRIAALSMRGGRNVDAKIDESEAIYLEKYADNLY